MLRIALLYGLLSFNLPAYTESESYSSVDFQIEIARGCQ